MIALSRQRFVGAAAIGWRHANVPDPEVSQTDRNAKATLKAAESGDHPRR
jgi:hypothetical protein